MEVTPGEKPGDRGRIVAAVRLALEPLRENGLTVHLVGSTVLSDALDQASRREALRTFPVALLCSLAVLALLLRTLRGMAVAASCAAVSVVLTLGLMAAVGRPLTMVSAALPSLLWVLSPATGAVMSAVRFDFLFPNTGPPPSVAGRSAVALDP